MVATLQLKNCYQFAMDERLKNLKESLGIDWGHLAERLGISRSMLGFIRRGDKSPSKRILNRVKELEEFVGSNHGGNVATNGNRADQMQRFSDLEARLSRVEQLLLEVLSKLSSK